MPQTSSPCRILVMDDDRAFLSMIQDALAMESGSFEVEVAESGRQGVNALATFDPDVVVLDVCLPDTDGIELLPMIQDLHPQAQILVSTGFGSEARREAALQKGAVRFLEKPFDLEAFKGLVRELAQRRPKLEGADVTLLDLVQMMSLSRKSARFQFLVGHRKATLRFQEGELVHLEDGEGTGESAFRRALRWGTGAFRSLQEDRSSSHPRTIHVPTVHLLLDALGQETPEPAPPKEKAMPTLKDLLKPLMEIDGTKVAVLVDWDGFVIDGIAREGSLGTDAVGAVISTVLGSTQVIGRELGVGKAELAMLEYERGSVLFRLLGQAGILAVVLENQSSLGLLRFQIRKRAPEIEAALG